MKELAPIAYGKEIIQTEEKDRERHAKIYAIVDVLEDQFGHHLGPQPELEDRKIPYSDLILPIQFEQMQSDGCVRIPYDGEIQFEGDPSIALFFVQHCSSQYREKLAEHL